MRGLGLLFCLLLSFGTLAFAPADEWNRGVLMLKDQRVLEGELSVRTDCNVVILRNGDALMVYPAHKIAATSIFDIRENKKRTFIAVRNSVGAAVYHELYEVILDGEIAVLRKEKSAWYSPQLLSEDDFDYFVYHEERLVPLNKFRKKLYRKVGSRKLRAFTKEKRLNLYRLPDTVRIIDYINQENLSIELARLPQD